MAMEGFPYGPPGTLEYKAYQNEWHKRKRKKDPVWAKGNSRKTREAQLRNPIQHRLGLIRRSAQYRGFECGLSDERLVQMLKQDCSYCNAAPNPLNGIDRIDSDRGYVEDNVTTACRTCNVAKNDMTLEEFKAWIGRVAKNMGV